MKFRFPLALAALLAVGRQTVVAVALGILVTTASVVHAGSPSFARELALLIASEEFCGQKFNRDTIAKMIEENVEPGDLKFTVYLETFVYASSEDLGRMTDLQKVAHCTQVERNARHYGLIK